MLETTLNDLKKMNNVSKAQKNVKFQMKKFREKVEE